MEGQSPTAAHRAYEKHLLTSPASYGEYSESTVSGAPHRDRDVLRGVGDLGILTHFTPFLIYEELAALWVRTLLCVAAFCLDSLSWTLGSTVGWCWIVALPCPGLVASSTGSTAGGVWVPGPPTPIDF